MSGWAQRQEVMVMKPFKAPHGVQVMKKGLLETEDKLMEDTEGKHSLLIYITVIITTTMVVQIDFHHQFTVM